MEDRHQTTRGVSHAGTGHGEASSLELVPPDIEFEAMAPEPEEGELDLAPMIDITFLLLIFFMVTATYTVQKTLSVPKTEESKDADLPSLTDLMREDRTVVSIDEDGTIRINNGSPVDLADLGDVLKRSVESSSHDQTIVKPHEKAPHRLLVKVIDTAKAVGVGNIAIAVEQGGQSGDDPMPSL